MIVRPVKIEQDQIPEHVCPGVNLGDYVTVESMGADGRLIDVAQTVDGKFGLYVVRLDKATKGKKWILAEPSDVKKPIRN